MLNANFPIGLDTQKSPHKSQILSKNEGETLFLGDLWRVFWLTNPSGNLPMLNPNLLDYL